MTKYCCVPGCKETGGFQFPRDPVMRKKWQVAIRREAASKKLWKPTDHSIVCQRHFVESDFKKSNLERLRKDLIPGAIPTVFDFIRKVSEIDKQQKNERANRTAARSERRHQQLPAKLHLSVDQDQDTDVPEIFLEVDLSGNGNLKLLKNLI